MPKALLIVCLVLPAFALAPRASADGVRATVADLAWMTGSWTGPMGDATLEENWIRPAGGTLAALIRISGDGATSMVELILIEEQQDSLVLRVRQWLPGFAPRSDEPWVMKLAEIAERRVGFVSAGAGDFQTLTYSRPSADSFDIDVLTKAGERIQITLHPQ